jgi:hypothetical protein
MSGADKNPPEKSVRDFLERWSRRKLGIAEAEDAAASAPAEPPQTGERLPEAPLPEASAEAPAVFDPASLPPIESIDATTDIRAFLAPGVPLELARAALRRAWTSDPAIRDFVGIAENQWDFTNPDTVPGFGSLEFTDEVRAMVSRLFGDAPQTGASDPADPERLGAVQPSAGGLGHVSTPSAAPTPDPSLQGDRECAQLPVNLREADRAALQNDAGAEKPDVSHRKHGAALPK